MQWVIQTSKGKGWRAHVLKAAFTKATYECWKYRNDHCFKNTHSNEISQKVIDTIVYKGWENPKIK